MATGDIVPSPTEIGIVFPSQVGVDYVREVGSTDKFSDIQPYTIDKIYGMIRVDLENVGVSSERVSFDWFAFFLREILNDYSEKVGEFQIAMVFEGGGGIFKIPGMRGIVALDVNSYGATEASEDVMTRCRAAGTTLRSNEFYYSLNGNLLSIYPALGSGDTITILASVFAEDFSGDSADKIILHSDFSALFHGIRWKCRESHGKDYMEAKQTYLMKRAERKSRVEHQLYPSQLKPADVL